MSTEKIEQQRDQNGPQDEQELASKQLQIQSKRFYIDVKENKRGRFIKLAEVGVGGRKNRILMSMQVASDFKKQLDIFSTLHSELGPTHGTNNNNNDDESNDKQLLENNNNNNNNRNNRRNNSNSINNRDQDGLIRSETINSVDRKRYYLDLKENQRGRFLRVSMVMNRGQRAQIAIPAQGLIEFKDELNKLLEQFALDIISSSTTSATAAGATTTQGTFNDDKRHQNKQQQQQVQNKIDDELPESKSLRAENKIFYFDCGSNQRGIFLRISEVRRNRYRTSITVPEQFLDQFQQLCSEYVNKAHKSSSEAAAAAASATTTVAATTETTTTTSTPSQ